MEDLLIFLGIVVVSVVWEKLKKALSNAGKPTPARPAPVEEDEQRESAPAAEEALPGEARSGHGGWDDVPEWEEAEAEEAEEPEYGPSQPDPSPVPAARTRLEEILRRLAEAQTVEAEPEETADAREEALPSPVAEREEAGSLEDDRPIWEIHSGEAALEPRSALEPGAALRSPARANRLALDRAGLRDGVLWSVVLGKPRGLKIRYQRSGPRS